MNLFVSARFWALLAPVCLLIGACAPGPAQLSAPAQTASSITSTQTNFMIPQTETATTVPTVVQSPTPAPQARVSVSLLDGFDEPSYDASFIYRFEEDDPLVVVGRDRDCTWLQVRAAPGQIAWVNTQLARVTLLADCEDLPHATVRPESGAVVLDRRPSTGYGEMQIQNGLPSDGCVLLADLNLAPTVGVFVRTGDSALLRGIPNGDFHIYFSTGDGWDAVDGGFTLGATYSRFRESIHVESSSVSSQRWTLTLHSVPGGTAAVQDVDPDEFPRLTP